MTEAEAMAAARLIHQTYPDVYADAVDPRHALNLHMDRSTVELLREAAAKFTESRAEAAGIVEIFDEWLAVAAPIPSRDRGVRVGKRPSPDGSSPAPRGRGASYQEP